MARSLRAIGCVKEFASIARHVRGGRQPFGGVVVPNNELIKGSRRTLTSTAVRWSDAAVPAEEGSPAAPSSPKLEKLLEEILALNMLEVRELSTLLKTNLGVEDTPMMAPMMQAMPGAMPGAPAAAGEAPAEEAPVVEEKTIFVVKLDAFDPSKKIPLIKEVRAVTGLGLKESKALVDDSPQVIKEGVPKEEAEALKAKLEELGGTIVLE